MNALLSGADRRPLELSGGLRVRAPPEYVAPALVAGFSFVTFKPSHYLSV